MGYRFLLWRDKLLLATLLALFNGGSTYLRVLLRALIEGREFTWSYYAGLAADGRPAMVSGAGLSGDLAYLLLSAAVMIWLLWAVSRRPDRLTLAALVGWSSLELGKAVWITALSAERPTISMETIGVVNAPLAWFSLPPLGIAWLLSVALLLRGRRDDSSEPLAWTRLNTVILLVGAVALGAAWPVMNLGPQHGQFDLLGLGLIYLGLLACLLGIAPWAASGKR